MVREACSHRWHLSRAPNKAGRGPARTKAVQGDQLSRSKQLQNSPTEETKQAGPGHQWPAKHIL